MAENLTLVEQAVESFYIGNDGKLWAKRFNDETFLVGEIVQDANYTEENPSSPSYIKNRPLAGSNVTNETIRFVDGSVLVGSSATAPIEVYSSKNISRTLSITPFVAGEYVSSGDIVMFDDKLWLKRSSGYCDTNPSIDKSFKVKHSYNLVKHVCELKDPRFHTIITSSNGVPQSLFKIEDVFDLYFHSESITFNGEPEDLKKNTTVYNGVISINNGDNAWGPISIVFGGNKTIEFDLDLFSGYASSGSFEIKSLINPMLYRPSTGDHLYSIGVNKGDRVEILGVSYTISQGQVLEIVVTPDKSSPIDIVAIIRNLKITYN